MFLLIGILFIAATAHAQYDPVVLWDRSGAGDSSRYGVRILSLGDQNNDGFSDFAVCALGWGGPGQANESLVEFFHGGNPPSLQPYYAFRANPATDYALYGGDAMGDVNGDGHIDWSLWRRSLDDQNYYHIEIYWGGPVLDTIPHLILREPIGVSVGPIGDFNGDSFDDIYIWHPQGDYTEILYGGPTMDTIPDWTRHSPPGYTYEALPQCFGDLNGDGFSDFVSGSGTSAFIYVGGTHPDTLPAYVWPSTYTWPTEIMRSLNGDGYDDIVFHGLRVHLGRDSLLSTPDYVLNFYDSCSPLWKFSMGDVNRDRYNDMGVIDDGCNNLWGTLCLYLGHPWLNTNPAMVIQGRTPPLNLIGIYTAAGLGDVNGDGIDDWAIGAFNSDFDGFRGRAVVISGDTTLRVSADSPRAEIAKDLRVAVYPNPFNGESTVSLTLPAYHHGVDLKVYNLLGQQVRSVVLDHVVGPTDYHFDGSDLTSGMYLLRVSSGAFQATTKLMLLR